MSMKILQAFAVLVLISVPILGEEKVMVCKNIENALSDVEDVLTDTSMAKLQELVKGQHCREENGLPYKGKCYIIAKTSSRALSYQQAIQTCIAQGAVIAEVDSMAHQQALQDSFESRIPTSTTHINAPLGMTYRSSERTLQFKSGEEIPINQFMWHRGYPAGSGNGVAIQISHRREEGYRWFFNFPTATTTFNGVLCEKDL